MSGSDSPQSDDVTKRDGLDDLPPGRIDVHSHLLPAIDDGCGDLDDVLDCVTLLIEQGYVGTICTPHIYPEVYPGNTPVAVADWVKQLQAYLENEGLTYRLWAGGELRILDTSIAQMKRRGVPTLGASRYVLCDFWETKWVKFVDRTLDWLLQGGYTPVLAHPERARFDRDLEANLLKWQERGVIYQVNGESLSGNLGDRVQQRAAKWVQDGLYSLIALDMHQPDGLDVRFDGLDRFAELTDAATLEHWLTVKPRELLAGT